jgi:hypothetical protein
MIKIAVVAVVALCIAGVGMGWSRSPVAVGSPAAQISIQQIHALAHLKGLPVLQFEESGVSYPVVAQK